MKIIKATWENRNLGCDAYEITLDRKDLKNFDAVLDEIHTQDFAGAYVTLKMPVGDLKALHALEDDGFRFMETQFHIGRDLRNYETPEMLKRYQNLLTRTEVPKIASEWQKVVDLITPDMFTTDRIYLDPQLKPEMSCTRYKNWVMDLVEKPEAHLFLYNDSNSPVGYGVDIYDEKRNCVHGMLGGVFEACQDEGLGFALWDAALRAYAREGFADTKTSISSNNNDVLRLYMFFGYKIAKEQYVLRKFLKERKNEYARISD